MIFGDLFKKPAGTRNLELLTEVFVEAHNLICESLMKSLHGVRICNTITFEAASRFEVGMYLLFHLDRQMCDKQEVDARRQLLYSCTGTLLPSDESRFIDIVNHRLKTYGAIFNEIKNSGGSWADVCQKSHAYLVNAIYYCGDKYEKMTTETMPLVLVGAFEDFYLKQALVSCELILITIFCCILKHAFSGNNNFLLLPQKEIIKRIKAGFQKGEAIGKSAEENMQRLSNSKLTAS